MEGVQADFRFLMKCDGILHSLTLVTDRLIGPRECASCGETVAITTRPPTGWPLNSVAGRLVTMR